MLDEASSPMLKYAEIGVTFLGFFAQVRCCILPVPLAHPSFRISVVVILACSGIPRVWGRVDGSAVVSVHIAGLSAQHDCRLSNLSSMRTALCAAV